MIHRYKHRLIAFLVPLLLLSSCEGFDFFQVDFAAIQEELGPLPSAINDDFSLPMPSDASYQVTWSSDTLTIVDNGIVYERPFQTQEHEVKATVSKSFQQTTFKYPLIVTSRLDAPLTNQVPQLNIILDNQQQESQIIYEDYIPATVTTKDWINGNEMDHADYEAIGIRTRGHSTRFMPKRPYRIRFKKNTSLFGMKSAKNYILLANYSDKSLMRNVLMMQMAYYLQDHLYPLEYRMIDLFINGYYRGVYLLTERVEFHPNRLAIQSDLSSLDAGFMVELDYQVNVQNEPGEDLHWFKMNEVPYAIAEPNTEDPLYTTYHTNFIKEYFFDVRDALIQKNGYESLIDVENWIDYFIVQELSKNVDVGWGSVYLVKEKNKPLKHMPLWDFDLAFGNADYVAYGPTGFWGFANESKNPLFTLMMKIPSIKSQYKTRLQWFKDTVLPSLWSWWDAQETSLVSLAEDNFSRWSILYTYVWPNPPEIAQAGYVTQLNYVKNYVDTRIDWLLSHL